jgi:tetratricopeptide (TPR) repeat protein
MARAPSWLAGAGLMARAPSWLAVAASVLAACLAARAQPPMDKPMDKPTDRPPADKPAERQRADANRLLDALKTAPDEQAAMILEEQVQQIWLHAGTPAVTLLMSRGLRSLRAGETNEAVDSLSDAITLQPDHAEAWHQRAIARFHAGDVPGAIHDLEETVRLEPRNFAAFRTLSEIAASQEDWKNAYAAWQKVLEIDPKTPGGAEKLRDLRKHALGEDT